MEKKRELYQIIEKIRIRSGSNLQYNGYVFERKELQEKIGMELENEIFTFYWVKEEMNDKELEESIARLNDILLSLEINKSSKPNFSNKRVE